MSTDEKTKGLLWGQLVFFLWGWHKRSLVLCLQEEKNSSLWLIVAPSGLNIMKYFSVRHNRHVLVTGLKLGAFASCLNLIEYLIFFILQFPDIFGEAGCSSVCFCVNFEVSFVIIPP